MFHRDALHTGSADQPGPPQPLLRWWQGGGPVTDATGQPLEGLPHGPQGSIFSSVATSEVSDEVPGATKVWYFHQNTWTGRDAVSPKPFMLRSEFPEDAALGVAISTTETSFETSAAMAFPTASGNQLQVLLYRNRDPNSGQDWVQQSSGAFIEKMRIPKGLWTFDFWISGIAGQPAATQLQFTVYRFPQGDPDNPALRQVLGTVAVPIPQTPETAQRRVVFVWRVDQDFLLDPTDGVAIGVKTASGSTNLITEGRFLSRVVTPIQVPAVYAGADDGSVWAFDAATGNVLWSYRVAGAQFRSSPAVGDDGSIYIGSIEGAGKDQGHLYAFNPDGTVKWIYPAENQFLFFHSSAPANLPPEIAAAVTDAGLISFIPGTGTDTNTTVAQTGTEAGGRYLPLKPRQTTTGADMLNSPPPSPLDGGWLAQLVSSGSDRTLQSGAWVMDLAFRARNSSASASGFVVYRFSKLSVVSGAVQSTELLGWTQHPEVLVLPADGRTIFAHIETPTVSEVTIGPNDFVFIELMVRQITSAGAGGGWEFLLEGNGTRGGPQSQLTTPGLGQSPLAAITSSPVISGDDVVYIATHGGSVHAVQAVDGQPRWVTPLLDDRGVADEIRSSPAFSPSGKVYIGSMNGILYALDGNNGDIIWRFPAAGQNPLGSIESSPALDESRQQIYFGADDGKVYAIKPVQAGNQITPQLQWSFTTGGAVTTTPAVGPDGTVYFGSRDHNMYAVAPGTGAVVTGWPYTAVGEIESSPALASPSLLFFVNEVVTDPPASTPTPFHLSTRRAGDGKGGVAREVGLTISNSTSTPSDLPPVKFRQEFRTHPQLIEPGMPTVLVRGTYSMSFWARALPLQRSAGERAFISFKVFHCTSGDSVGELILNFPDTDLGDVSRSAKHFEDVEAPLLAAQDLVLAPDDYLRVEVWGHAVLNGGNRTTIFFDFDGNFLSSLAGPTLVYFATSVVTQTTPTAQVIPAGRIYCLDHTGRPVWIDPIDGLDGFNPRPEGGVTSFAASPALFQAASVWPVGEVAGQAQQVIGRIDPVVYLGGQDAIMYAIGPTPNPPPFIVLPPPLVSIGFAMSKAADKDVVNVDSDAAMTPDEVITYTLRYRNTSGLPTDTAIVPAEGVVIQDPIPAGVVVVAASAGGYPADAAGNPVASWDLAVMVKWDIGEVWPQESGDVWFQVWVNNVNVVPPLGMEQPPVQPPLRPEVYISKSDPVTQGITAPDDAWDFQWGDMVYILLGGRGKPGIIINSDQTAPAIISAETGEQAFAGPVTVSAGWGKQYRLAFIYDPANVPDWSTKPTNQYQDLNSNGRWDPGEPQLAYTIDLSPMTASATRSGRPEEVYEYEDSTYPDPRPQYVGQYLGLTVFKVQLTPRGYAYSPNAVSVTEQPNRPWSPYYWRIAVQQSTGVPTGAAGRGEWGPLWEPNLDANGNRTKPYDFMIHNPMVVSPATYNIAGGAAINPNTQTPDGSFRVANISRQPFSGTGPIYPRNVVRWDKVDLAQSGAPYGVGNPDYQFRDENYLPENLIHISRGHLTLGPGQSDSLSIWAEVPEYLWRGTYAAPRAPASASDPATSDMPIYVDLNGNLTWDPGETKFENEYNYDATGQLVLGDFGPFVMTATTSLQPWAKLGQETVDFAKAPPGTVTGAPTPALLNLGNDDLVDVAPSSAVRLDPNNSSGLLPLERSDLAGILLRDPGETRPAAWDLSAVVAPIMKTPVGAPRPNQQWVLLNEPGQPSGFGIPSGQPSGTYSGLPDAVASVSGITSRSASPFRVRVVERRLTGYDASGQPLPGTDIDPWASWVGTDTLRVLWSSNRRADKAAPTASDPYMLWYDSLDRATDAWNGSVSYPDPAQGDPMDSPTGWITKSHLTPAHGVDTDTTEWLFWSGSDLRPTATGGHTYDNRLLWANGWPPLSGLDYIQDDPDVAGATGNAANMSDVFRLEPRPVFWDDATNEYNCVVFVEQSASQPPGLWERFRSRTLGGSWSAFSPIRALPTSNSLTALRDPSAFEFDGYLWVLFAGASKYTGNHDIYCARYDPATLGDPSVLQVPFAPVCAEVLVPDAARTTFASRHKEWRLSSPAPALTDVKLYVENPATGMMVDIGGTGVSGPDADGWYTIAGTSQGDVRFHPGQGTVRFAAAVAGKVGCDYTPKLLRLTVHHADEYNPSAFVEYYRYVDQNGVRQPDPATNPYNPRLYVFWNQEGLRTGGAEITYQTLREDLRYYFHGEAAAEPAAAGLLQPTGTDVGQQDVPIPVPAGLAFVTQAGDPGVVDIPAGPEIPDGPWVFDFWAYAQYADPQTDEAHIKFQVYRRDGSNVNTPLFETAPTAKLGAMPQRYTITARPGAFALNPNDRIYVVVVAEATAGATAHFLIEDGAGSNVMTPLVWTGNAANRVALTWDAEAGSRAVPVDHTANEFGLCAVKDPLYAQVWLFWSSTRSAPTGTAAGAAPDSDLYYQVLDPALP